jgi:two-component system CheB/CheR fusion protein
LSSGSRSGGATDWSEALRLSHEELESSREELQALNEELRASNDQLNLANDDLAAANVQLRSKIEELETQSNVLSSGAVMTLFLDHELRVRWFTPAISQLFPLMPSDVGAVRAVMQRNQPHEAEVHNVEGRWFLRRIGPYRATADTTAGVAVTFTDITARKRAEGELQARNKELERFNKVAVGRELRMIELKKQINELLSQRCEPARYALEFEAKDDDTHAK